MELYMQRLVEEMSRKHNQFLDDRLKLMTSGEVLCVHETMFSSTNYLSIHNYEDHVLSVGETCTEKVEKTQYIK